MGKSRALYGKLIKEKLKEGDLLWLPRQGIKYFKILGSSLFNKQMAGPLMAGVLVTYRCNAHCMMCDLVNRAKQKRELTTEEFKTMIDDLDALGCNTIGYTGGEPLLREDIFEILTYTRNKGIASHLSTNGYLMDEEMTKKVLDTGLSAIAISLDAANEDTHALVRGHKGGLAKVERAVKNIVKLRKEHNPKVSLTLGAIISHQNLDQYLRIIEMAREWGADNFMVQSLQTMAIFDDKEKREDKLVIKEEELEKFDSVIEQVIELKLKDTFIDNSLNYLKMFKDFYRGKKVPLKCFSGYAYTFIGPDGDVFPCWDYIERNIPIGNITETRLKEFWYSEKYDQTRMSLKHCGNCSFHCHTELNLLFRHF